MKDLKLIFFISRKDLRVWANYSSSFSWLYAIFVLDFNSCYSYEDITKQLDELEMCKSNEKVAYLRGHNEARNDHPLAALDSMHKYFDKQLELLFVSEKQVNQIEKWYFEWFTHQKMEENIHVKCHLVA